MPKPSTDKWVQAATLDIDALVGYWERAYLETSEIEMEWNTPLSSLLNADRVHDSHLLRSADQVRVAHPDLWFALNRKISWIPPANAKPSGVAFIFLSLDLAHALNISENVSRVMITETLEDSNRKSPISSDNSYRVAKSKYLKL